MKNLSITCIDISEGKNKNINQSENWPPVEAIEKKTSRSKSASK